MAETIGDHDQTVREVQKSTAKLPPEAFISREGWRRLFFAAVDAERPPLRLVTGTTAVKEIGAALQSQLEELEAWRATSEAVDGAPAWSETRYGERGPASPLVSGPGACMMRAE